MIRRRKTVPGFMAAILGCCFLLTLSGCGSGGPSEAPAAAKTETSTTTGATAAYIKLSANPVSIKSDDSNTSTITATVLDANFAAIKNMVVAFKATGGKMSNSSAITDASGKASISFSSGTLDQSNRVVALTGTASGLSSQVPVAVSGSTLTVVTDKPNIPNDGSTTARLTVTAQDAGGRPVYDVPITLAASGAGGVVLSQTTKNTDVSGQIAVTVTGTLAGAVTITASGLGATATQAYTIQPVASTFAITAPADDPHALATNTNLTVTVNAPAPTTTVQFAATLGVWDGGASSIVTKPVVGGTASAVFKSVQAGLAAVEVSDVTNNLKDTVNIAVSAPSSAAAQVTLQPSAAIVAPSSTTVKNTVTLTATVRTSAASGSQVVGNAAVAFSIQTPTGGGETISPVVAYTNSVGVATATFTSGSLSTGQSQSGVTVKASVLDGTLPTATTNLVIGGTAGSVVIGYAKMLDTPNQTTYRMPMSVLVADTNGNPKAGATVSLSLWPVQFSAGRWYNSLLASAANVSYKPYIAGSFSNNDVNENTILDPGEDVYGDGRLTPPNSAAGTLPTTVTTDENGVANFYLTYLKSTANWIVARVRASTLVFGTETSSSVQFRLPYIETEAEKGLVLADSTYPVSLTVGTAIGSSVSYTFQPLSPPDTFATNSAESAFAGNIYTFTSTKVRPVGEVIQDSAIILGTYNDSAGVVVANGIGTVVPIRIVVK